MDVVPVLREFTLLPINLMCTKSNSDITIPNQTLDAP